MSEQEGVYIDSFNVPYNLFFYQSHEVKDRPTKYNLINDLQITFQEKVLETE